MRRLIIQVNNLAKLVQESISILKVDKTVTNIQKGQVEVVHNTTTIMQHQIMCKVLLGNNQVSK